MDIEETCNNGHPRTPENTGYRKDRNRRRYCKVCVRESQRRHLERTRGYAVGNAPPREWATHCRAGHEWTDDNTYRPPGGGRQCRACLRSRAARRAARLAAEAGQPVVSNRTHCKHGHEWVNPYRGRCRTCRLEQKRARDGVVPGARRSFFQDTCKAGHDLAETRYFDKHGRSEGCGVCQAERLRKYNQDNRAKLQEQQRARRSARKNAD